MTSQSEVIRLTKLCQRQRATINRLREELDYAKWVMYPSSGPVKHPQQAEQGWEPPPGAEQMPGWPPGSWMINTRPEAQTWWIRFKRWVTT